MARCLDLGGRSGRELLARCMDVGQRSVATVVAGWCLLLGHSAYVWQQHVAARPAVIDRGSTRPQTAVVNRLGTDSTTVLVGTML